jgi:hypothetical protein
MWQADQVTFAVQSDIVIVGSNPEMADMSNPRGDVFGLAFYVVASNAFGDTKVFPVGTARTTYDGSLEEMKATDLAARLTARADGGKLPVGFAAWQDGRAVYGSDAYVAYGADDDIACERMAA